MGSRPLFERPVLPFVCWALVVVGVGVLRVRTNMAPWQVMALYVCALSLLTLVLFAIDKRRAARGRRRVSERNLLLLSLLGGAPGGLLGMWLFRHKSRRWTFRILLPLFAVGQVALVYTLR